MGLGDPLGDGLGIGVRFKGRSVGGQLGITVGDDGLRLGDRCGGSVLCGRDSRGHAVDGVLDEVRQEDLREPVVERFDGCRRGRGAQFRWISTLNVFQLADGVCWLGPGDNATAKLLVDGFTTKITHAHQELGVLVHPSAIDLSNAHLYHLARHLALRRQKTGCYWRRLTSGRQALLVLAHLRCGDTYARPAAGLGIAIATVYRYIREAVEALAALAPSLADAVRAASRLVFVLLDGTLLFIDRIAADRPFYRGKHKKQTGMNVQALTDPLGRLLWASPALPGAIHGIRATRTHGVIDALTEMGVACWADSDDGRWCHRRVRPLG